MTKAKVKAFINDLVKLRGLATDEMSLQIANLYPSWKVNVNYLKNDRVLYNGVLYKVLIDHISQSDLTPDVTTNLFAKVLASNTNITSE